MLDHIPFHNAKILVMDWNGTLFAPPTSEGENIAIARAIVRHHMRHLIRKPLKTLATLLHYARARRELKEMIATYHAGDLALEKVFAYFNKTFVQGAPSEVVRKAMTDYAKKHCDELVAPSIGLVRESQRRGLKVVILSVAAREVIEDCLVFSPEKISVDRIYANYLHEHEGVAHEITLDIYGRKEKVLAEQILKDFQVKPENVLYCGDSEDDAGIAPLIPQGSFIVSPLAKKDFRAKMMANFAAISLNDPKERYETSQR